MIRNFEVQVEMATVPWQIIALKIASYILLFPLTLSLLAIHMGLRYQYNFTPYVTPAEMTQSNAQPTSSAQESNIVGQMPHFQERVNEANPSDALPKNPRSTPHRFARQILANIHAIIKPSDELVKCHDNPCILGVDRASGLINALARLQNPNPQNFDSLYSEHRLRHPDYELSDYGSISYKTQEIVPAVKDVHNASALGIAIKIHSLELIEHICQLDPTLVNKPAEDHAPSLVLAAKDPDPEFSGAPRGALLTVG